MAADAARGEKPLDEHTAGETEAGSAETLPPVSANPDDAGESAGFWRRIKAKLFSDSDPDLRASLEDVIDQHEHDDPEFSHQERSMLRNVLGFGEKRVDDVMVPRADIVGVDRTMSIGELMLLFKRAGHSRLPVYRTTLDDVMGMVHIKDVMGWLTAAALKPPSGKKRKSAAKPGPKAGVKQNGKTDGTAAPKANGRPDLSLRLVDVNLTKPLSRFRLIREVLYVPPSMPTVDLLLQMQSTRIHMAVVIDEYGGTDGLVSIEDLVEEIVGEIEDEHDREEGPLIVEEAPGRYIADARVQLDDLGAYPGLSVLTAQDDDIDTLGGFVFAAVGRVPLRGELIAHDSGLEFEVLDADPRRLKKLRIHLHSTRSKWAAPSPGAAGARQKR